MPYDFCTRLTAKIRRLGYTRWHAERLAPVAENLERIREQQVALGKEIGGLFEGLMQRAFRGLNKTPIICIS
jgi:hypothetical protein